MSIEVGITEFHGIALEYSKFPPDGVRYSAAPSSDRFSKFIFKSAAKGVYAYVNSPIHDIIEAPLFPVLTNQPWIYTPARFTSAGTFDFFGVPTPRFIKMIFASHILKRENFKKLLFKSEHGRQSLFEYGGIDDAEILSKTDVLYPAVRPISDEQIIFQDEKINLLFIGEFIRKGGANVVDAFLRLEKEYDFISLTICADPDLKKQHPHLGEKYMKKINECNKISIRHYDREVLFREIIPNADIYLCPTYQEAWGFSIQEAMAFGKPIITTDISAIPEMIEHQKSGITIPIRHLEFIKKSKGYIVDEVPSDFMDYLTNEIYKNVKTLIEDFDLRKSFGLSALHTSRTKFSMKERQRKMLDIYKNALR